MVAVRMWARQLAAGVRIREPSPGHNGRHKREVKAGVENAGDKGERAAPPKTAVVASSTVAAQRQERRALLGLGRGRRTRRGRARRGTQLVCCRGAGRALAGGVRGLEGGRRIPEQLARFRGDGLAGRRAEGRTV